MTMKIGKYLSILVAVTSILACRQKASEPIQAVENKKATNNRLNPKTIDLYLDSVTRTDIQYITVSLSPIKESSVDQKVVAETEESFGLAGGLGLTDVESAIYPQYPIVPDALAMDKAMGLRYYTPEELETRRVAILPDGTVIDYNGAPLRPGDWIFVMDETGNIYIDEDIRGKVHHSSFFGGKNISAGGSLQVDETGKLIRFNNSTGHYKVPPESNFNFLTELSKRQVELKELRMGTFGDPEKLMNVSPGEYAHDPKTFFENKPDFTKINGQLNELTKTKLSIREQFGNLRKDYVKQQEVISDREDISVNEKNQLLKKAYTDYETKELLVSNRLKDLTIREKDVLSKKNNYYSSYIQRYTGKHTPEMSTD
ncbi:MAG: hypothetical protein AB8G05_23485 [Oligoflexales bacterium]